MLKTIELDRIMDVSKVIQNICGHLGKFEHGSITDILVT